MPSFFKVIAENRKARFDFNIIDTYEAGLVLKGTEIKSLRVGNANLKESFARVENEQMFIYGMHISPYSLGNRYNVDPIRTRKLLLKKEEIKKLLGRVQEKGLTLIPLKLYFKGNWAKITIALCQAKKVFDKRASIKKRETDREMEKAVRRNQK